MSGTPDHDVVVLGGGPAGAAAAICLARAGRAPLIIERDAGPRHKVCGEFLSVEAQACLADLGVDPKALGAAPIATLRLVCGASIAQAPLPFRGLGLTRRALDEALLRQAERSGAVLLRGTIVREVAPEGDRVRIGLADGRSVLARTAFLATGKHDLRSHKRPMAGADDLVGFKTYLDLAPSQVAALRGAIEVVLFEGGYAGLQLVERGTANLCLLVRKSLFEGVGKTWSALLAHLREGCPVLDAHLDGATALLDKPLATFRLPYGFVHEGRSDAPRNLFRLGDQAGVIHPFSGDGISIALHTGRLAAATLLRHGNAARAFHKEVRRDIKGQIRLASMLYGIGQTRLGRHLLLEISRASPAALRLLAARTRIPDHALRRTGALLAAASP